MFSHKQRKIILILVFAILIVTATYNVNSINNYSKQINEVDKIDTLYVEIVYLEFDNTDIIEADFTKNISVINTIFDKISPTSTNLRVINETRVKFNETIEFYSDNDSDYDYGQFFDIVEDLQISRNSIMVYNGESKTYNRSNTAFYDLYNSYTKTVLISFQSTHSVLAHEIFHILQLKDQYIKSASYDIMDDTAHSELNNLQQASILKLGWNSEYYKIDSFIAYSDMQLRVEEALIFEEYGLYIEYNEYLESMYAYTYLGGYSHLIAGTYYDNNNTFVVYDFQNYYIEITLDREKGIYQVIIHDFSEIEIGLTNFVLIIVLLFSIVGIDIYYRRKKRLNQKEELFEV